MNRLACASLLLLCSCAVGPRYERPEVDPPERYRAEVTPEAAASFADLPWWEVFGDPTLRELVENSLAGNWDIQIAVQRSEQARQQVGGTRSAFFPQLSYMGSGRRSHSPINQLAGSQEHFNSFLGVLDVAWEIDLWGRIRRANQAARNGIEWGLSQAINSGSCVASSPVSDPAFSGFSVDVRCNQTTNTEGNALTGTINTYRLEAVASIGAYGSLGLRVTSSAGHRFTGSALSLLPLIS